MLENGDKALVKSTTSQNFTANKALVVLRETNAPAKDCVDIKLDIEVDIEHTRCGFRSGLTA